MKREVHELEPIWFPDSRVLILGSFPSVVSRKNNMYYANPANRFWRVMENIFEDSAADKLSFLKNHHIALWDVIASCMNEKSYDASISDITYNDIESLMPKTEIRMIFTTGGKAADLYRRHFGDTFPHTALPSTSGANARMSFEVLCDQYRMIREYTDET